VEVKGGLPVDIRVLARVFLPKDTRPAEVSAHPIASSLSVVVNSLYSFDFYSINLMPRSLKKGPFVEYTLERKIEAMNNGAKKTVVKTWSRRSMVIPEFVGHTIAVHNGNKFIPVYVTENMVGHKLGEFSPTRTFRGHSGNRK
jgi:small subunit ribosomal protein S19